MLTCAENTAIKENRSNRRELDPGVAGRHQFQDSGPLMTDGTISTEMGMLVRETSFVIVMFIAGKSFCPLAAASEF